MSMINKLKDQVERVTEHGRRYEQPMSWEEAEELLREIDQLVALERERCAVIAERYDGLGMPIVNYDVHYGDADKTRKDIALLIRNLE